MADMGWTEYDEQAEAAVVGAATARLVEALQDARVAVRAAAEDAENGLERGRLHALADALAAELRVQRQKREAA